jgi:DNA replication protein DnaC
MAAPSSFSLLNKSNKEPKYVNKLLNNAQCTLGKNSLQGISPLCEKELNDIVAYRQSKQVKQEQCTNSSPITINRTRPSQMSLMGRSQSQSVLLPSSSSFNNTTKTLTRQSSSTNNLLVQLTECQRKVLAVVKKKSGGLFFTGSGGTGKSFLINVIRKCLPSESCFVTASTGVAASLIDGVTLHSFSGISTELMEKLYELENEEESVNDEGETSKRDRILKEILNKVVNSKEKLTNWKKCLHLVIDEISMVDAVLFETLDFIAR